MKNLLDGIEDVLLMGPGPSSVYPDVYKALSRSTLGYLDSYFIRIMDQIKALLQKLMRTQNELTLAVSGTGMAGMETCLVNLLEPKDAILILINGVFGTRMREIATRLGAEVDVLEFEWGTPVQPDAVEKRLKEKGYKLVAMVHAETSTGVRNPAAEIGKLLKASDSLYLLDAVTSLGGIEVDVDGWGVDALYSGSQKCLSCPPGLSPVTFSQNAVKAIAARKSKTPSFYLDIDLIGKYWGGEKRAYHHTAPMNMFYGLYQALLLVMEEGIDKVFARHLKVHETLVQGLEKLGLELLVDEPFRLPMLNAVKIPEGVDDAAGRSALRSKHTIEIGAGLGPLAGKIWRIGVMGHTAREKNVERLLAALGDVL
ncbi:MAG: alanine--glyoxylate aminotransferase family protein [Spirochaetaceae bacterium]|nr:MAG: alanine--glyoxylate aminotransferase family protein [Spirochaetaceae bacterium]